MKVSKSKEQHYCNGKESFHYSITIVSSKRRMKPSIIAFITLVAASSGSNNNIAQAHEIPHLRGFIDVFETSDDTSDATCPENSKCRPKRPGGDWESGCESCPGMPDCFNFNGAADGTFHDSHCCNSTALHDAPGGLTLENIEKHCHVPSTCPKKCRPKRRHGDWESECESCPDMPDCIILNGAADGTIDGNHCCNSTALHGAPGGLTRENIEAHCNI